MKFNSSIAEWTNAGHKGYSNSASPYSTGDNQWAKERFDLVAGSIYEMEVQEPTETAEEPYLESERHVLGDLAMLDTKARKGKPINVLKLVAYLYTVTDLHQIVFNNSWGIVVRECRKSNIPAKCILFALFTVIRDALCTPDLKDKETILIALDEAPERSVAGRIWAMFESVTLVPVVDFIHDDDAEEIPAEDVEFWRAIYSRRDRAVGRRFKVC